MNNPELILSRKFYLTVYCDFVFNEVENRNLTISEIKEKIENVRVELGEIIDKKVLLSGKNEKIYISATYEIDVEYCEPCDFDVVEMDLHKNLKSEIEKIITNL